MRRLIPILGLVLIIAACGGSESATTTVPITVTSLTAQEGATMTASQGDTVSVHYTGTLDDGTQFDSSAGRDPLTFTVGSGQLIAGFDDAVTGMAVGDTKTVRIPAEDAYGPYLEEAVLEITAGDIPPDTQPGDRLQTAEGQVVRVLSIENGIATLDFNHELAGEPLTFEITLVSIGG